MTVSGSAEMETIPNEIYVRITLREYREKGESKKDIETIKSQLPESCKAIGLTDSTISILVFRGVWQLLLIQKKKERPCYVFFDCLKIPAAKQLKINQEDCCMKILKKNNPNSSNILNFIVHYLPPLILIVNPPLKLSRKP